MEKEIESIVFTFPEMINNKAEDIIRTKHNEVYSIINALDEAREKVRELEFKLEKEKALFKELTKQCTITYKKEEQQTIQVTKSNMLIKNRGNDTLGTYSG